MFGGVCLQDNAKTIEWILIKLDGQWTNPLNFGADRDKGGDPGYLIEENVWALLEVHVLLLAYYVLIAF